MSSIADEYFPQNEKTWFDHPRLRRWRKLIDEGAHLTLEILRDQGLLETVRPLMYVESDRGTQDREEWSEDLHRGLLKLHVRAISRENEALRFAVAFQSAFEPAESRFGEGYFNAVLNDVIQQGPLAAALMHVLKYVYVLSPDRNGGSYRECHDMIDGAIKGRALELVNELSYSRDEAPGILTSALARYLDDRFSVSDRKALGWAAPRD